MLRHTTTYSSRKVALKQHNWRDAKLSTLRAMRYYKKVVKNKAPGMDGITMELNHEGKETVV